MAPIKKSRAIGAPNDDLKPTSLIPGGGWVAVYTDSSSSDKKEAEIFAWALLPEGEVVGLVWTSDIPTSHEVVEQAVWTTKHNPTLVSAEAKFDGNEFQHYKRPSQAKRSG
jgi:hypothetical protein